MRTEYSWQIFEELFHLLATKTNSIGHALQSPTHFNLSNQIRLKVRASVLTNTIKWFSSIQLYYILQYIPHGPSIRPHSVDQICFYHVASHSYNCPNHIHLSTIHTALPFVFLILWNFSTAPPRCDCTKPEKTRSEIKYKCKSLFSCFSRRAPFNAIKVDSFSDQTTQTQWLAGRWMWNGQR